MSFEKITAVVVDDEESCRENLMLLLERYCPRVEIVSTAATLNDAAVQILRHEPLLVFLDINLGAENAFTLLEQLEPLKFEVIFTTAHHGYAIKAFNVKAIDYLLKPIELEALITAVEKATERIQSKELRNSMDEVIEQVQSINRNKHKIGLATASGYEMVYIKDIAYCLASGSYTEFVFTSGEKLTVSKNLKYYENALTDYGFLRSHNTALVNLAYIKRIERVDGGGLVMEDGNFLPVSRQKRKEMEEKIKENRRLL